MPQTLTVHLPTLLKRYEALTREIASREAERMAVHDQILAAGRGGGGDRSRLPDQDARRGQLPRSSRSCATPCTLSATLSYTLARTLAFTLAPTLAFTLAPTLAFTLSRTLSYTLAFTLSRTLP
jgi:hypothetical protein